MQIQPHAHIPTIDELLPDSSHALDRSRFYNETVDIFSQVSADDKAFLDAAILAVGDSPSPGWLEEGNKLQTIMISKTGGWISEQTWGFERINGIRHHTRRGIVTRVGEKEARRARLVYDYVGSAGS